MWKDSNEEQDTEGMEAEQEWRTCAQYTNMDNVKANTFWDWLRDTAMDKSDHLIFWIGVYWKL